LARYLLLPNQKLTNQFRRNKMKSVLSTIVAAIVALSFAGIVCAAEPTAMPAGHPAVAAPAADAAAPAKPAKKKKTKKAKKPAKDSATPAADAAPAAK
jgi:hypothetical protein